MDAEPISRPPALALLRRAMEFAAAATGWRAIFLAFAAGALSTLAIAPASFWPVLLITIPTLIWQIDGAWERSASRDRALRARLGGAAWRGWAFGLGYFSAGLYWIGGAFLVQADKFAAMMPVAVGLLAALMALYFALGAAASALFWSPGPARVIALALGLSATEWLRGHLFTGFPWNTIGYAGAQEFLAPLTAAFGIYGLSLLVLVFAGLPAAMLAFAPRGQVPACGKARAALGGSTVIGGTLAILSLIAFLLYPPKSPPKNNVAPDGRAIKLRIVQPNIAQRDKFRADKTREIFNKLISLSRTNQAGKRDDLAGVTHLIWPETAVPILLLRSREALRIIADMLPRGTHLVVGVLRRQDRTGTGTGTGGGTKSRVFNSIAVLDDRARLVALYDKVHLVPFGEYLPFQETLEAIGLEQLTRLKGGFAKGTNALRLEVPGLDRVLPAICYEVVFPGDLIDGARSAGLLLNLTNDAWFGRTAGPYQHLQQTRTRAMEYGLPVLRIANTGISAAIDGRGQTVAQLRLNRAGVIDIDAKELTSLAGPTIYGRFGDLVFALLAAIFAFFAILLRNRR